MPNESQNQQGQKSHEQLVYEATTRRRKPLIDLTKKTESEALKAKDEEIQLLTSQLRKLQESVTHKEAYIQELEDKLANALNPPKSPEAPKTEEIPGTGRRRARQQVQPEAPAPKPEDPQQQEEQARPAPSAPPANSEPGDGIVEDD